MRRASALTPNPKTARAQVCVVRVAPGRSGQRSLSSYLTPVGQGERGHHKAWGHHITTTERHDMYYYDHGSYAYDPKASPLYGAPTGYGIPAHTPAQAWDTNELDNWAQPPANESTVCYCGHQATPHGVGREHHGSVHVPTPEGGAQDAYDRFENGTNVVPS